MSSDDTSSDSINPRAKCGFVKNLGLEGRCLLSARVVVARRLTVLIISLPLTFDEYISSPTRTGVARNAKFEVVWEAASGLR